MLSRFISKPSNLRFLALISSQVRTQNSNPIFLPNSLISTPRTCFIPNTFNFYSTNHNNDNNGGKDSSSSAPHLWDLSSETDSSIDSIFGVDSENLEEIGNGEEHLEDGSKSSSWIEESSRSSVGNDDALRRVEVKGDGADKESASGQEYKPWSLAGDEKEDEGKLFDLGEGEFPYQNFGTVEEILETKKPGQDKQLQEEEEIQTAILEGTVISLLAFFSPSKL